jgi:hypothetical protein
VAFEIDSLWLESSCVSRKWISGDNSAGKSPAYFRRPGHLSGLSILSIACAGLNICLIISPP